MLTGVDQFQDLAGKDLCSLTMVLAGVVSSRPMDAHFGRKTRIIHLISYNFIRKHAFWTASFQCLTKSLSLIGDLLSWVGSFNSQFSGFILLHMQKKTKELEDDHRQQRGSASEIVNSNPANPDLDYHSL